MSLKERVYSILIVSATDSFTSTFAALFQKARYSPVETVTSVSKAKWLLISELHMSESDAHRYIENKQWTGVFLNESLQKKLLRPTLNPLT